MSPKLEYDGGMNRALVTGFAGFVLLTVSAAAQINAAPPSVTSLGFGGRAINGTPPSVTSLGPHGYTPGFNPAFPNSFSSDGRHHRHRGSYVWLGIPYALPNYYPYDDNGDDPNAAADDQYNGGPTLFDRRGPGSVSRPPASAYSENAPTPAVAGDPQPPEVSPPEAQPPTVLVFKDGHQLEVANYAIVGDTLYDLTDGHRRRIALSDLDLDETTKRNDDRGVDFQVPSGS
jgi:hypothetical protein